MRNDKPKALVVLTSVANEAEADALSRQLVEEGLAACVTRLPGASTYRWQGKVESEQEWLLLIKTSSGNWDALRERIDELHPYDLPELIALSPAAVETTYLGWLIANSVTTESSD